MPRDNHARSVLIEVHDWGNAEYWPCPRLAPTRLIRSPAAADGSRCASVLSRKVGGLITAACGLGGPHYARKEKQPYPRSPPSPPIPLLPPAGAGGRVFNSSGVTYVGNVGKEFRAETAEQPVLLQDPLSERQNSRVGWVGWIRRVAPVGRKRWESLLGLPDTQKERIPPRLFLGTDHPLIKSR